MWKEPIELPIFFTNDKTREQKLLGKDYFLEEFSDLRSAYFFHIDAIIPYIDSVEGEDDKYHTEILANGQSLICSLKIKEVLELIEVHNSKFEIL